MNKTDLVEIRDFLPDDTNFIFATFLRGLYYGESWFTLINKNVFMERYHKVAEYLLKKPSITIKIACLKEDQNAILGYAIYENNVLHWVFVKKAWRSIGIAKDLVPSTIKIVTHLTKSGVSILSKKNLEFNPFLI